MFTLWAALATAMRIGCAFFFSLLTYKKNRQPGILPNVRYLLVIISKLICQLTIAHSDIHQTAAFENTLRSENTKNSKYTNGAMVVVVTFDASLGRRTEVNQQRDRPTSSTEITERLVVFAFRELGERFALHDDVAHR